MSGATPLVDDIPEYVYFNSLINICYSRSLVSVSDQYFMLIISCFLLRDR